MPRRSFSAWYLQACSSNNRLQVGSQRGLPYCRVLIVGAEKEHLSRGAVNSQVMNVCFTTSWPATSGQLHGFINFVCNALSSLVLCANWQLASLHPSAPLDLGHIFVRLRLGRGRIKAESCAKLQFCPRLQQPSMWNLHNFVLRKNGFVRSGIPVSYRRETWSTALVPHGSLVMLSGGCRIQSS